MAGLIWITVLVILVSLCALACFVFSRFFTGGAYVNGSYQQGSLLKSYWGVRPLSEQTVWRLTRPIVSEKSQKHESKGLANIFDDDEEAGNTGRHLLKINDCAPIRPENGEHNKDTPDQLSKTTTDHKKTEA